MSYAVNVEGHFNPEYAEVYGVPFSFIPCSGATKDTKPGALPTRVRALENRIDCEIAFPRLLGYRYDVADKPLTARFTDQSGLALSTADIPTRNENAPIVGESSIHTLDDLKRRRPNEVAFLLARLTLGKYFRDDDGNDKPWLFPQLLGIAKRWLDECVTLKDNTFPQLLLLIEFAHDAADRIYKAIVDSTDAAAALKPILRPYDTIGSTRYVDFDTTRPVFATRADKCHCQGRGKTRPEGRRKNRPLPVREGVDLLDRAGVAGAEACASAQAARLGRSGRHPSPIVATCGEG